jgi:Subtilase family
VVAPRNRKHLLVPRDPAVEAYGRPPRGGGAAKPSAPVGGRQAHGIALRASLQQVEADALLRRAAATIAVPTARSGIYVEFEAMPGLDLAIKSFEQTTARDQHTHIEVVAVRTDEASATAAGPATTIQRATVFVPDGKTAMFVKKFEAYAASAAGDSGRHRDFADRISSLRLATIQALWTDAASAYPKDDELIWWEVWLRKTDGHAHRRFSQFAKLAEIELGRRKLEFDDRIVVLVRATPRDLGGAIDILDDIAEFRRAKDLAAFLVNESAAVQGDWVRELAGRIQGPERNAVAVTVLDSGVTQGHPLLAVALDRSDVHAVDPAWGGNDDGGSQPGHGTQMAGLALYDDLSPHLAGRGPVVLKHRLESVKILPPPWAGVNAPDNYGAVTATAVSYPEIQAPERGRVFSMAVTTSDQRDRGQPTAWSAAVDALCVGRSFAVTDDGIEFTGTGPGRLFVISAGNTTHLERAHLVRSDLEPVEDPAQAWNALTVGAFTRRAVIEDVRFDSWTPLSPAGELSPHSTTSVGFSKPWPVKPDIVMEGGNVGVNGADEIHDAIADLEPLTTNYKPLDKAFVTTSGTSAACSSAARLCARVMADYRDLWPETVRGLLVHAARWTQPMFAHLATGTNNLTARSRLLRRYGYGVPDEERVLRSANDALTLIAQSTLQPFNKGAFKDMHLFDLPWPTAVLQGLGELEVRLNVTLSYFIEPNPARRGWQARHRYQSHALRFEVRRPAELTDEFRRRVNQLALEDGEARPDHARDAGWYFGAQAREHGSVHSDYWTGTAADLAQRGMIAVHPVTGWWKEQKKRDRSAAGVRYALIVSIETPGVETDIWTPVAQQIQVPVDISV